MKVQDRFLCRFVSDTGVMQISLTHTDKSLRFQLELHTEPQWQRPESQIPGNQADLQTSPKEVKTFPLAVSQNKYPPQSRECLLGTPAPKVRGFVPVTDGLSWRQCLRTGRTFPGDPSGW